MKKKSLNRLSAFFNILLVVFLLLPNFLVSASVFAANPVPSLPISGIVGSTTADPSATFASSYLRYVGNPAPSGFSHAYQWEDPYYVCDPNSNPVVFNGTINTLSMIQGGVAFVGLIDKELLESDKIGYQSGAYAYIYKNSPSTLRIGPTDGNLGGEIVQIFKDYPIPADGIINLQITIYNGKVALQVNGDTVLSDDYGIVKTRNNDGAYSWNEFEFGAVPGWDNTASGNMPYNFSLTGCQEILPPDTTAPIVGLILPSDNYFTKLTSVLQTWESDDTDIDYYEYESCSNDPDVDGFCTRIYSVITENTSRTVNNNNIAFWWRVRAVDLAENIGSWTEARKITIDTILPTKPVFTAPENNLMSTVNSIRLTWTGGDDTGSGIKNHIFGYTFTSAQSGNISFWNTGLLLGNPYLRTGSYGHGEGKYEFYVKTIDNAGNESPQSDILTVYFDGTAPAMPAGLYWMDLDNNKQIMCGGYSNTHHTNEYWDAIMGDVSFSHYEYSSFNAPNGSAGLVEKRFDTNFFNSSWWNIPTEGTYGFRVRSVDTFGNKSNWALTDPIGFEGSCKITIDWTAPVVEITNPSNNTYVKGTVSFKGSVADENLLRYYYYIGGVVGNTVVTDLAFTDKEVYSWNTTSNPDGLYIMRLEARDKANNKTAASVHEIKVTVDNALPTGEITGIRYLTEDSTNFVTNDKSPLIFGTSDDNYEVDSVEVKIGDVLGIVTLDNDDWIAQFPTLSDGTYTISLKITDKAGNITEVTKNITIDSVAPSAVYTHYIKGELFVGDIAEVKNLSDLSFTGAYTDPNPSSGLKYDSYVIFQAQDDGSFGFAANGKQSYCSWRTSPNLVDLTTYNLTDQIPFTNCIATLPDGEYYMTHQVYDNAVRYDIPTIFQFRDVLGLHFKINNTPVVTITTPFTEVVQGTALFTVQADAVNGNSPLTYLWTGSNGFSSTEKSFIFNPVTAGVYSYTVRVTDADGDSDEEIVTITVKAPVVQPAIETPEVLGTTTTNTITPVVTRRPLVASNVLGTSTEFVQEDTEEVPEVLGEEDTTCTAESVSGHVYMDKDENNIWDQADESFSGIKIKITTKENDEEKIVEEFLTDEQGAWKTTLCAGTYYISIDTTSIPDGYKLNGDSTIQIDVLEGDTKGVEQSFLLTESKTFLQKYWWILLLAILVVTSIVIAGSKKDEKQSS